ncbi:hypothetical protein [Nonomuraea sp. NPDC005501]
MANAVAGRSADGACPPLALVFEGSVLEGSLFEGSVVARPDQP